MTGVGIPMLCGSSLPSDLDSLRAFCVFCCMQTLPTFVMAEVVQTAAAAVPAGERDGRLQEASAGRGGSRVFGHVLASVAAAAASAASHPPLAPLLATRSFIKGLLFCHTKSFGQQQQQQQQQQVLQHHRSGRKRSSSTVIHRRPLRGIPAVRVTEAAASAAEVVIAVAAAAAAADLDERPLLYTSPPFPLHHVLPSSPLTDPSCRPAVRLSTWGATPRYGSKPSSHTWGSALMCVSSSMLTAATSGREKAAAAAEAVVRVSPAY